MVKHQTVEKQEHALAREERKTRENGGTDAERRTRVELAKLQAQKELELARLPASSKPAPPCPADEWVERPCLLPYEDRDDFLSYLTRFERIVEHLKINKEAYAVRLEVLLSGKATKISTSLSPEILADYALLKKSLLKSFCKPPDGFQDGPSVS